MSLIARAVRHGYSLLLPFPNIKAGLKLEFMVPLEMVWQQNQLAQKWRIQQTANQYQKRSETAGTTGKQKLPAR
jgi:hypothetical protein